MKRNFLHACEVSKSLMSGQREIMPCDIWINLDNVVFAANPSADFVTQPLYFPDRVPGTPIAIAWSTSDYRVVDYSGGVHPEYCSEDGELVVLTALMTYGDWEATMQIPVRVCLPEGTTDADRKMLEETLAQAFSEQAYDDSVNLPEQIGGEGVEFYRERRFSPWMFGVPGTRSGK